MAITVIPFSMPDPMEIPEHISTALRAMAPDEAVSKGMELLAQIDAADTLVYDKVADGDRLVLGSVFSKEGDANGLEQKLRGEACYGRPLDAEGSLAGAALAQDSALLVMGQADEGEAPGPFLRALMDIALNGASSGNIGFNYVLTFKGADGRALGTLTLLRPHESGPLNHEQPNITEGLRRLLADILQEGVR